FEDQRPFYDWLMDRLVEGGLIAAPQPRQYEFARLNLTYVITSKRKLKHLVDNGIVSGWDDPRMPTIVGLRRRGYTPESIRLFCDRIGVTKDYSWIDYSTLEGCLREDLENKAHRGMAVLDPVKLVLTNWDEVMGAGHLEPCSLPALPPVYGVAAVVIGGITFFLFIRHARRHPHPVLELRLLGIETFRSCVTSGTVFRIAMGAIPFLLPLMLQVGFGLTPFQSGTITFMAAAGVLFTKAVARHVFARFGFRRTLLAAAALSAIGSAANAFFFPDTPHIVMIVILFMTGFVRSFFFTGINVLGFADIERHQTGQATALNATIQQITGALGVAFAGIVLELHALISGDELSLAGFHIAFLAVAVLNLLAAIPIWRLPPGAGSNVS
ncbi:MAG: MFS transporter, partial [Comamonadaceae bacterium]